MLARVANWDGRYRLGLGTARFTHVFAILVVIASTALIWAMAFYSDNRDRNEDLFGFYAIFLPIALTQIATLISGLTLLDRRSEVLEIIFRVTTPVTLISGSLTVLALGVGIPIVVATLIARNRDTVVVRPR